MTFTRGLAKWIFMSAAMLALTVATVGSAVAQSANANPNAGANGNKGGNSASVSQAAFHANGRALGLTGDANINAIAAGLNSIGRNWRGLWNGKDTKLDGIRNFVLANVNCELNCDDLEDNANTALVGAAVPTPYDEGNVGAYVYAVPLTIAELIARYEYLMGPTLPEDDETLPAYEEEIDAIELLFGIGDVATYLDALLAASDIALRQALSDGTSPGRDYDDPTLDELVEWAREVLGVDEAEGAIDEIIASME